MFRKHFGLVFLVLQIFGFFTPRGGGSMHPLCGVKVHYTPKIVLPNIEILHLGLEYMGTNCKCISKLKLHVIVL